MKLSSIPKLKFLDSKNFFLIAGPCAIEGEEMAFKIAEIIIEITDRLKIPFIFKGSFKKAILMYQLLQIYMMSKMLNLQLNMLTFFKYLLF